MRSLSDHDIQSLSRELEGSGFKAGQAPRLLRAFYDSAGQLELETLQLGTALTRQLQSDGAARLRSQMLTRHRSTDGTLKLLIGFTDGAAAECVLMPGHRADRAAACVSSQVGCAMGCDFCASTKSGLSRDLTAGEIVEQFLHLKREAMALGRRLASLVFMGMGEPLANYDQVAAAIPRIADAPMGALGWRHVTVSTVGIVPAMDRLADSGLGVHLALSLHAADDELRSRIVPVNRRWGVAALMDAAKRYAARTRRVVTIEWCLLADVNDTDEQAEKLAALMDGFRAHVNLIPFNPIGPGLSGAAYERPTTERIESFIEILTRHRVVAHLRDTRGDDVAGACGQLRVLQTAS
jgi:23S rRNA (adenine2503-C2)-methyltransferase